MASALKDANSSNKPAEADRVTFDTAKAQARISNIRLSLDSIKANIGHVRASRFVAVKEKEGETTVKEILSLESAGTLKDTFKDDIDSLLQKLKSPNKAVIEPRVADYCRVSAEKLMNIRGPERAVKETGESIDTASITTETASEATLDKIAGHLERLGEKSRTGSDIFYDKLAMRILKEMGQFVDDKSVIPEKQRIDDLFAELTKSKIRDWVVKEKRGGTPVEEIKDALIAYANSQQENRVGQIVKSVFDAAASVPVAATQLRGGKAKSTKTDMTFTVSMNEYVTENAWAQELLNDSENKALKDALGLAVKSRKGMAEDDAAALYKLLAKEWLRISPDVVKRNAGIMSIDIDGTANMSNVELLGKKLLFAYSSFFTPEELSKAGLKGRHIKKLDIEIESGIDDSYFMGDETIWGEIYRGLKQARHVIAPEAKQSTITPPPPSR